MAEVARHLWKHIGRWPTNMNTIIQWIVSVPLLLGGDGVTYFMGVQAQG